MKQRGIICLYILTLSGAIDALMRFNQPRENVWVTLANLTGQSSLCLALGSISHPFRTCLVGLPVWKPGEFCSYVVNQTLCSAAYTEDDGKHQCELILSLNTTLESPPEELELFGSANASITAKRTGKWVSFLSKRQEHLNTHRKVWASLDSALDPGSVYEQLYSSCNGSNITTARELPTGIFLICGDRAWNGIPIHPQGGPCYLGRLSLFHPNMSALMKLTNRTRTQRSIHELDCSGIGEPRFWTEFTQVLVATILPGGAANKAMNLAKQIGCWAKDELNRTSEILDRLTADVESVNHAVLQNRAATDFLLLAQGHGCEEFEGMCCMNLTDNYSSVHAKIRKLQGGLHSLKQVDGLGIESWLKEWGLSGWLISLIKSIGVVILVIVVVLLMLPCIVSLLQRALQKTASAIFLAQVQKENGGDVEQFANNWLREKGHSTEELLTTAT